MKVIFLSAVNSIHTVRWVNSLSEKGIEVHLVSLPNHREREENKISKDIKIYYLPFKGFKGYYLNILALKQLIKKINPDLLNVHYASGYGTLARLVKFDKTLLNVWGSDIYDFPNGSYIKRKIVEKNLKGCKYLTSTSNVMAKEAKKYTDKIFYITPFGVDTNLFKSLKKMNKDQVVIGVVKTLKEKYGIEFLIKGFKILLDTLKEKEIKKEIKLEIYGEGELKNQLIELSKKLEIDSYVSFKGYINNLEVPKAINKMDIFCVPSISESFGVAAVEAMACEVPVVSSDADGFTEVMKDNYTGYIIPKKNEEAIAEKLFLMVMNEDLRKEMGKNGRRRVLKLYDWNKNVEKMISVYKEILEANE